MAEIRSAEVVGDCGMKTISIKTRMVLAPGALCECALGIVPFPKNMLCLLNLLLFLRRDFIIFV
jgi:hypothetical protein